MTGTQESRTRVIQIEREKKKACGGAGMNVVMKVGGRGEKRRGGERLMSTLLE